MSGTYPIVRQLLNTGSDTAIGIGYVLQALLQAATKPGGKTPIIVQHTDRQGTIRVMMFSRQTLSITFSVRRPPGPCCRLANGPSDARVECDLAFQT